MFCGKCGAMIEEGSTFCHNCGEAMEVDVSKESENLSSFEDGENQKAFCGKCGTLIEGGSSFCANCGETAEDFVSVKSSKAVNVLNNKRKLFTIIVSIILTVTILISGIVIGVKNSKGYEKAAVDYIKMSLNCDLKKAFKYSVIDYNTVEKGLISYIQEMMDEKDMTEDEFLENLNEELEDDYGIEISSIKDILSVLEEQQSQALKEEYGEYKVDVKVISSHEEDSDEVLDYISNMCDTYQDVGIDLYDYINVDKIKKVYSVKCRVKIKGEDDSDIETIEHIVFKYKGDWKIVGALSTMDYLM